MKISDLTYQTLERILPKKFFRYYNVYDEFEDIDDLANALGCQIYTYELYFPRICDFIGEYGETFYSTGDVVHGSSGWILQDDGFAVESDIVKHHYFIYKNYLFFTDCIFDNDSNQDNYKSLRCIELTNKQAQSYNCGDENTIQYYEE